ncbi:MAG: hypothetical protein JEZ11_03710 [Desulfobacterales bacterium]|nr:hypothetical protein [Desulfobacterales bacterium]
MNPVSEAFTRYREKRRKENEDRERRIKSGRRIAIDPKRRVKTPGLVKPVNPAVGKRHAGEPLVSLEARRKLANARRRKADRGRGRCPK